MDDPGNNKDCNSEQAPYCPNPTKYEIRLFRKLKELGIECILKYWNGEKYIDIAIPGARLYVEINGSHLHYTYRNSRIEESGETSMDMDDFVTVCVEMDDLRDEPEEVAVWLARIAKARSLRD